MRNAISALRNCPQRKRELLTVKDSALKSGLPPMAASSGVMKLSVNAVTRAPKATPMSTATARSTTLPRSRNFWKPLMALPRLDASWHLASCRGRAPRSGNGQQHAGVEDAGGIKRRLGSGECSGERLRPLAGVPTRVVAADGMVMRDRAAGGEDGLAGRRLDLVPLGELAAASRRIHDSEVRRRAVGIDVGEPAGHAAFAADRAHRGLRRLGDLAHEAVQAIPGDRGLERLDEQTQQDQLLAHIRRAHERGSPGFARAHAVT